MCDTELVRSSLTKIQTALDRSLAWSADIPNVVPPSTE